MKVNNVNNSYRPNFGMIGKSDAADAILRKRAPKVYNEILGFIEHHAGSSNNVYLDAEGNRLFMTYNGKLDPIASQDRFGLNNTIYENWLDKKLGPYYFIKRATRKFDKGYEKLYEYRKGLKA